MPCARCDRWTDRWIDWLYHPPPTPTDVSAYFHCDDCRQIKHEENSRTPGTYINAEGAPSTDADNETFLATGPRGANRPSRSHLRRCYCGEPYYGHHLCGAGNNCPRQALGEGSWGRTAKIIGDDPHTADPWPHLDMYKLFRGTPPGLRHRRS